MINPRVSMIIPAYNCGKYIKQCIDGLLAQTYSNIEILIADDASTDNTKILIDEYDDVRIKTYHNLKNMGVVKTRNKLIELASGDYIALQDADDWSEPTRIERQVNVLRNDREIISCGTGFSKVNSKNKILYQKLFPEEYEFILNEIPRGFLLQCPSVMFRASYIKQNLYSDFFGNSGNEDLYLMGKLILKHKFINLPEPLYNYRLNDQSLTKLGQQNDIRRLYINRITTKLLEDYRRTGTNWIESGEFDKLSSFERSIKKDFEEDSNALFEYNIGQMLYWKNYFLAFRIASQNIFRNGLKPKNIRLLLYVVKMLILRK